MEGRDGKLEKGRKRILIPSVMSYCRTKARKCVVKWYLEPGGADKIQRTQYARWFAEEVFFQARGLMGFKRTCE